MTPALETSSLIRKAKVTFERKNGEDIATTAGFLFQDTEYPAAERCALCGNPHPPSTCPAHKTVRDRIKNLHHANIVFDPSNLDTTSAKDEFRTMQQFSSSHAQQDIFTAKAPRIFAANAVNMNTNQKGFLMCRSDALIQVRFYGKFLPRHSSIAEQLQPSLPKNWPMHSTYTWKKKKCLQCKHLRTVNPKPIDLYESMLG
ncbi:hypothetical protein GCK32_001762 [Trichostrongylus colubriformis]|uniref:Uncharacterized protein n=1 Tax=Trichostrongylus colubriformis TaxID=6319 RepID=A0AAN8F4U7_TRICO